MARLAAPAAGISPVTIATTPTTVGATLTAVGYGRTRTEWVPNKLHAGPFTVNAVTGPTLDIVGASAGSAICKGDAGGPVLRQDGGAVALVGVSGSSWQGGCFGETETRTDAVAARTDDLKPWIDEVISGASDFNCDGARDVAIADPDATVNGAAKAGRVQLVHGAGKGNAELSQALPIFSGAAEVNDRFGGSLATFDHNLDGCTDLAVGVPGEAIGTNAGAAWVSTSSTARPPVSARARRR